MKGRACLAPLSLVLEILEDIERFSPFGLVYTFATGFGIVTRILLLQEVLTYVDDVHRRMWASLL